MTEVNIPKEITFVLPEGEFDAVITCVKAFVKQTAKGSRDWIRVLFEVEVPEHPNLDCRAGRNFQLNLKSGSDLRNWLTGLLGPQFFRAKSGSKVNLELLEGTRCRIELEHIYGKGDYENPLVVVSRVLPRPEPVASTEQTEVQAKVPAFKQMGGGKS
jgi:hypothetical protein